MPDSSDLADKCAGDINNNKCKDYIDKILECIEDSCKTKYKDYKCYLEYVEIINNILKLTA